MCGIFGEITFGRKQTEKSVFLKLLRLSKNRGPDKEGYYSNGSFLQFGFNRLKVLDLSENGYQPIMSQNKRYVMVFNGEIYNYLDIKNRLSKKGFHFKGTGDSEVIINSFQFYGLFKTINMIDGMFAISLYDNFKKKLHLIRDFAGIKPLHYGFNNKAVVFASQYNQIAKHPIFCDNGYNQEVLKLFLSQSFIPAPFGIIKQSFQVMPGEVITFDEYGNQFNKRYWELPKLIEPTIFNEKKALEIIHESLNSSVKKQLISDVPLGVFLSSGIDSTLISLLAKKISNKSLNAYTIGSNSQVHDETEGAKKYAKMIGLQHTLKKMNGETTRTLLDEINKCFTEPFSDLSLIPTYYISKIAKKDVTVVLSGDGGDELFFGYERFWSIAKNLKIQNLPYFLKYGLYGIDKIFSGNKYINSNCLFKNQGNAHYHLHKHFNNQDMDKIFPYLKTIILPKFFDIYRYKKPKNELELLQLMRHSEFYGMMQKTLRKVDMASMNNSLEVRVPFLNKSLIESTLKIDPFLSYGPNIGRSVKNKILLKKALKSHFPNIRTDQLKKGFSVPLSKWLREDLFKPISEVLLDNSLNDHFGLNKKELKKMLEDHYASKSDKKWPLFTIYSLFQWKKNLSN